MSFDFALLGLFFFLNMLKKEEFKERHNVIDSGAQNVRANDPFLTNQEQIQTNQS